MSFAFVKGDEVLLRARPEAGSGWVVDVILSGVDPQYKVVFDGQALIYSARHLEHVSPQSAGVDDVAALLTAGAFADADAFRAFMTLAKLESPLADNLYSFAASRTERLSHQFKPVLKLLANPYGRLLIADEVGLGKTIEAGIILTELGARSALDHVLIACPSPLTEKWRREMRERFLLDFDVLDGAAFREFVSVDANGPAAEPRRVIASIELLRREDNLAALGIAAPRLDVVIVDEAHHMRNVGTATNQLGRVLTRLAETAIFLTATPLNLGRDDFFQLMHLLVPEEFPQRDTFTALIEPNAHINAALRELRAGWPPDYTSALASLTEVEQTSLHARFLRSGRYVSTRLLLERGARGEPVPREDIVRCQRNLIELNTLSHVFTRTRKREVQELFPTRRAHTVGVNFTAEERVFYNAVTDWALETHDGPAAHLVSVTFQRLAASCLPALGRRLIDAVSTGRLRLGVDELAEVVDNDLDQDAPRDDDLLADDEASIDITQLSAVDRLIDAWRAYGGRSDSKYDGFEAALRAAFEQGADRVLVFSYFTGTIDYLAQRLAAVRVDGRPITVLKLYGPTGSQQRERAVETFRDAAGPIVLLSSEVGSEGLDFQFCARMFNYDLPWNPMRVEQRIGRLDRYGQASELIYIFNMIVADTVEERIFFRLYERIDIFESSIGDLEAILGSVEFDLARLAREAMSGRLTEAELDRRRNTIADVIVRRQQDNDDFEAQSKQFLSNDDVFLELFNDIERSRRYVTPDELQLLVARYLAVCGCAVRLSPVANRRGVFRLEGAIPAFRTTLTRLLAHAAGGARATRSFIARLDDGGLDVTFDPAIATADRRVEFVSLHHPIIRAASLSYDLRAEVSACTAIQAPVPLADHLAHTFFIFELRAQGMKDELELVAAVVHPKHGIQADAGHALLGALDDGRTASGVVAPGADEVARMQQEAFTWASGVVASREQELQARNDETITAQVESLRLSVDRRRLWLREQIEETTSASISRMHKAQLSRLDDEASAKLAALEAKRGVSVAYRLVAAGLVTAPHTS